MNDCFINEAFTVKILLHSTIFHHIRSETWHPEKKTKLHCERGFLRIDPDSKKLALMSSHIFGKSKSTKKFNEYQLFDICM